ncbi:putative repeat protein (TIGR01451 family) [Flavobacterium sp. 2755]|uniref:leucine-rich repeat protein n=1 Tax=Flavobacterium sp. 2755 TaxID=2817765 RepID=UPI00285ED50A|nr:leucine-rich repeat protein [Flavobacterium sp. 2755]MDR6762092.1 putative repeat protein (TIGR01451 family) [Flavobacterium sp. 2755]
MRFYLKAFIFLILTSLLLSCSKDEEIDTKNAADLSVAVTANLNNPIANTDLTFNLIASNAGPLDATNVEVLSKIPSGYTFISAQLSDGTYNEETGIWSLGKFSNGSTATLSIHVKINASGEYNTKTVISGEEKDLIITNNEVTTAVNVKPLTDDLLFTYEIVQGAKPEVVITGLSQLWKDLTISSKYDLTIPSKIEGYPVTKIGGHAFESQTEISSITISNGVTTIGEYAFVFCDNLTAVSIPNSVTSIKQYAFKSCPGLTNINVPDTVEEIGNGAFMDCINLTSFAIPNNLNSLGDVVFLNCPLVDFTLKSNSYFSVIDGVLFNKEVTALRNFPSAKSSDAYAIPEGVTMIEIAAFAYAAKLTEITIPESLTTIQQNAFAYCTALKTLTIPKNVVQISFFAFSYNTNLTSVTINSTTPPNTDRPFLNCKNLKEIKVPNASLEVYKASVEWSIYKDILVAQ